jgi:hypothetical protein
VLLERAPNSQMAGRFRTTQNWIGGNDYSPCGAAFVPPPPGEVDRWLDVCAFVDDGALPPLVQAAIAHARRTKPAAANAIGQLEAAGILLRLTQSARNRAWEADGLLDLIVGLAAGVSSSGRA